MTKNKKKRKLIARVSLAAATAATIGGTTLIGSAANAQSVSCYSSGNSVYCSDGYSQYSYGNSVYGNDGFSAYSFGNSAYGSYSYAYGRYAFGN